VSLRRIDHPIGNTFITACKASGLYPDIRCYQEDSAINNAHPTDFRSRIHDPGQYWSPIHRIKRSNPHCGSGSVIRFRANDNCKRIPRPSQQGASVSRMTPGLSSALKTECGHVAIAPKYRNRRSRQKGHK
jgi:hypothetical protein